MTLNISPDLTKDLQTVLTKHSYKLQHAVINTRQTNHRYCYAGNGISLLIEFKKAD